MEYLIPMLSSLLALTMLLSSPGETAYLQGAEAQRTGQYAAAASAYARAAESEPALRPYALAGIATAHAAAGNRGEALRGLDAVLETYSYGPWVRLVHAKRAEILEAAGDTPGAIRALDAALDVEPVLPWWMEKLAWKRAAMQLETPDEAPKAFVWYRDKAANSIYFSDRRDAAAKLLESPDTDDHALAIVTLIRSGEYEKAERELLTRTATLRAPDGQWLAAGMLATILMAEDPAQLRAVLETNRDKPWLKVWLVYAVRAETIAGRIESGEKAAEALYLAYPDARETGEAYWYLGHIYDKRGQTANSSRMYGRMANDLPEHYRADNATFELAEQARSRGDMRTAAQLYTKLGTTYPNGSQAGLSLFTAAELMHEAGDADAAIEAFRLASAPSRFGDFFAYRALQRLHELGAPATEGASIDVGRRPYVRAMDGFRTPAVVESVDAEYNVRFQRLAFFGRHGLDEGEWEVLDLMLRAAEASDPAPFYARAADLGFMHTARQFMYAREWGLENGVPTRDRLRAEYPLAYWDDTTAMSRATGVDPYIILSVARQESTFRATVVSRSGAVGVMQLMPATANWMAEVEPAITREHSGHLASPVHSIRLGAYYLMRMLNRSDDNVLYALASYNGGPGNVDKWRRQLGELPPDQFIAKTPFEETKGYMKKVLGNAAAYMSLYGESAPLATE